MVFKYRTDPPSFKLTNTILTEIRASVENDTVMYFLGYAVLFTSDKKKRIKNSSSFHGHAFTDFVISFGKFVQTADAMTAADARDKFMEEERVGPYTRTGIYDQAGNWMRSLPGTTATVQIAIDEKDADRIYNEALLATSKEAGSVAQARRDTYDKLNDSAGAKTAASSTMRDRTESFTAKERDKRSREKLGNRTTATGGAKDKTAEDTRPDDKQASEIVRESALLSPVGVGFSSAGRFDLSGLSRDKREREEHVPVARGDYGRVTSKIVRGKNGGYVITGPTGCGKSTVALLPLFADQKSRVLVVEPTQANAANILHEFTNILPNMVAAGIIDGPVPATRFVAPTVTRPPFPQLSITTTEKLLEYFFLEGKLPKVDFLVLDEFHLPIPSMVQTVEMLRTFRLVPKYVLVSATAVGYSVSPQLPRAVTQIYGNLPLGTFPSVMERSDLDPRRWFKVGDGTVAVVTPSVIMAKRLYKIYREWSLRAFLVTRETVVSSYMRAATDYSSNTVFVLEPGVEAGVTLSISVLISMGTTSAIRYDGKVVLEDSQPLDEIAAIQRGGRGGRVKPTLYVTPRVPTNREAISTADYYRAQAVIMLVAMGARLDQMKLGSLLDQFPKLGSLTKNYASQALSSGGDPFLAVYRTAPSGKVYKECGGDGEGFDQLAKSELFVYHYGAGFFVAPVADFSDIYSDPSSFVVRKSQIDAASKIVAAIPGLESKYDLEDLVAMVIGKFDVYVADLFSRMKEIFTKPQPASYTVGSERPAEVADFLSSSQPMVKLFEYLKTEPMGVAYKREVEAKDGKLFSKHSFLHSSGEIHFAFDDRYLSGKSVNVEKVSQDVYKTLKGLLCIEMLLDGAPNRCVDLRNYEGRVPNEHHWFRENVVGRGPVLN